MQKQAGLFIFGEVLFDCFPGGEQILGGAPFNVAWHLQALGDRPLFISRIGEDAQGGQILQAMRQWGMETGAMQIDTTRPTGRVEVRITNNEPSYDIVADSAYDRISAADLPDCSGGGCALSRHACPAAGGVAGGPAAALGKASTESFSRCQSAGTLVEAGRASWTCCTGPIGPR